MLAANLVWKKVLFEKVLDIIKTFTPSGIASSSLQECVIVQIKDMNCDAVYVDLAEELVVKILLGKLSSWGRE